MNSGVLRGMGRRSTSGVSRSGLCIAKARSIAYQSLITTVVDLTGLTINFDVRSGEQIEVELWCPWISAATALANGDIIIRDAANNFLAYGLFNHYTSGITCSCMAKYAITTPGTYSLKGSLERGGGTGTYANNFPGTAVSVESFIKATVL